jgi:hypothetical protein
MNIRPSSVALRLALGAALFAPSFARAQDAPASTSTVAPLAVHLELGWRSLDPERVRAALERELGKPVLLSDDESAPLELEVSEDGRLSVRYSRSAGPDLVRQVDLPADDERALEVMALLAGNLTRDEASELIDSLNAAAPAAPAAPAPPPPAAAPEPPPARTYETSPSVNLSLFHPLQTTSNSEEHAFALELGLAYGRVGAIDGFGANLGVLHVDGPLSGLGMASFWTKVGGPIDGVTASLLLTQGNDRLDGVSLSGFVGVQKGAVDGAQLAVLAAVAGDVVGWQGSGGLSLARSLQGFQGAAGVSIVRGDAAGVVGAGGASIATGNVDGLIGAAGAALARDVEGAVLAGAFTIARDVDGVQGSAGVNVARDVEGVQMTGGANVAHDVSGLQLAAINVAHGRVDGLQLGVINVASEVHGAALGIISIAGNGHVQPSLWTSSELPLHASVKFLAGYAYSELGVGLGRETSGADRPLLATEGGVGAHVPLIGGLALEPGVHFSHVFDTDDFKGGPIEDNIHYRLRGTLRLSSLFEIFAGGGARHGLGGRTKNEVAPEVLAGVSLF